MKHSAYEDKKTAFVDEKYGCKLHALVFLNAATEHFNVKKGLIAKRNTIAILNQLIAAY